MPPDIHLQFSRRDSFLAIASSLLSASRLLSAESDPPPLDSERSTPTTQAVRVRGLSEKRIPIDLVGEVVTTAQDGGILLRSRDNRLFTFTPDRIDSRENLDDRFSLLSSRDLSRELAREFPTPFRIVERAGYLLCSDASDQFLDRCGSLFLRLRKAFVNEWKKLKFPLDEPEQDLVVLIFSSREDYRAYASREFDQFIAQAPGYYSVMQNRIVLYDVMAGRKAFEDALEQITTIVHEAAHQLAFNYALQRRLADNPLWLTEGLAMYFETPDLQSPTGWKKAGLFNPPRARDLYLEFEQHPDLALSTLLASDALFREPRRESGAYALAWGLFYFLMKQKTVKMIEYLKGISGKPPLVWDTPEQRIHEFELAFGTARDVSRQAGKYFAKLAAKLGS